MPIPRRDWGVGAMEQYYEPRYRRHYPIRPSSTVSCACGLRLSDDTTRWPKLVGNRRETGLHRRICSRPRRGALAVVRGRTISDHPLHGVGGARRPPSRCCGSLPSKTQISNVRVMKDGWVRCHSEVSCDRSGCNFRKLVRRITGGTGQGLPALAPGFASA